MCETVTTWRTPRACCFIIRDKQDCCPSTFSSTDSIVSIHAII